MKKVSLSKMIGLALLLSAALSCTPNEEEGEANEPIDNFDRSAMLVHWADDYAIPAYQNYHQSTQALLTAVNTYVDNPTAAQHSATHAAFREAYRAWQAVSFLAIGPAEEKGLRNFTNVYPTDTAGILEFVNVASYNLTLPSTFNRQGFPAIDYLLSGLGTLAETNTRFGNDPRYGDYLQALAERLELLAGNTLADWENDYRQTFVSRDGSSAAASVNKMVNDYVFHFEKELRAGKVGIPAGVFSGNTLPQSVEAVYTDTLSQSLFLRSLAAHRNFFTGMGFNGQASGESLQSYLDYLGTQHGAGLLSEAIVTQMDLAEGRAQNLASSFRQEAESNPQALLAIYDDLQQGVVYLKVDMLQALNVRVDYIDADGD